MLPSRLAVLDNLNVKVHYKRRCPGHNVIGIFSHVKMASLDRVLDRVGYNQKWYKSIATFHLDYIFI